MRNSEDRNSGVQRREKIKQKIIPGVTLLLIIVISVAIFFYERDPASIAWLEKYRYLGAFLIGLVGNASVLLPGVVLPVLTALGVGFYRIYGDFGGPVAIGMLGGAVAAIGEIVGYAAGYSGRRIVKGNIRYGKWEERVRRWGTPGIFIFSLLPLFFDLVGVTAGIMRFPLWKFVLVCWLGRTILYVVIIILAALGFRVLLPLFS